MQFARRRGLDVKLAGALIAPAVEHCVPSFCAVLGDDAPDLRPEFRVAVGDKVRTGQILFVDRKTPDISFASPATGVVTEIKYGARRTLGKVVIETADDVPLEIPGLGFRRQSERAFVTTSEDRTVAIIPGAAIRAHSSSKYRACGDLCHRHRHQSARCGSRDDNRPQPQAF